MTNADPVAIVFGPRPYIRPHWLHCPDCGAFVGFMFGKPTLDDKWWALDRHRKEYCSSLEGPEFLHRHHAPAVWERVTRKWASKHREAQS